ncbi:head GIN domain-containing protein [Cognatitamlana onchidii]|uniref:head GIN domain-containing protein n=1 Tax=Cognatitamlana onchidii TaxID=2562860 RepID=UPI0010A664F7|nr:head GIN domain-containing protein [Algibacter onchidii]
MKTISILKIAFTIISCLLISTTQAQWKKIKGNGNKVSIMRSTPEYSGIKCAGSFDYILVKGKEGSLTLEGDENLLDFIITEVKGDILKVKVKDGVSLKTRNGSSIKITIPFESINKVALAGSGDLYSKNVINTSSLDVSLAGSGDITLDIKTESVESALSGSGDITLKGTTENLESKVAGSGDFHGFELDANNTEVYVAGSGDAKVVGNKTLKARVSGSGDIAYHGSPEKEDTKVSGSGSISN